MKLKNLLEAFETQRGSFPDTTDNDSNVLGRGYFASVKPDKEDPHMIIKKQHREDPSYDTYVDFLVNNKLAQANPHFPRIYEISKGQWKMEKLPFTLSQFFSPDNGNDQWENNKQIIGHMYLKDFDPARFSTRIFENPENIKLGTYRKALELVHTAREKHNQSGVGEHLSDDLHPGNIMVRLTPHGPQLVITDPWS